jgi:excisionase family DNA binding protein
MPDLIPVPETYSVVEAARRLGVSRPTLDRAIDRGEFYAIRVGHRRMIPRAYLDRLFENAVTAAERKIGSGAAEMATAP